MDFQWAKKAISIAQKRIDAVLDINPEGEANDFGLVNFPAESNLELVVGEDEGTDSKDGWELEKNDVNSWSADLPSEFSTASKDIQVVDAEPNPIRDSHSDGLYQHSPATNSPDEGGCSGDDHDVSSVVERTTLNNASTDVSSNLSEITLSGSQKDYKSEEMLSQNVSYDDALTIVSSDIEVLQQVASSLNKKNTCVSESDQDHLHFVKNSQISKEPVENVDTLKTEIAQLRVQIQYQERRNSDLQARNQKLEKKTREYLASEAACARHNAVEAMFKKKLSEKETELASLLKEGEKLAEVNGKLSKEVKRLKKLLSEQETLKKKNSQLEVDRDVAKDAVRTLTLENNKLRAKVESMELESSKTRNTEEILVADLKRRDEKVEKLTSDLQRAETDYKDALAEIKQLESTIQELSGKVDECEISNKDVEEVHKGLNAAIDEERRKNERQMCYISSLEKRLSEMMDNQHDTAEMVALANQPLLSSIQQLQEELQLKERDFETSLMQKENMISVVVGERDDLLRQNKEFSAEVTKLRTLSSESQRNVIELSSKLHNLESNCIRLEADFVSANKINADLKSSLHEKKEEVENLYIRLRAEAENFKKIISEKENKINALVKRCEDAETALSLTRETKPMCHEAEKSTSVISTPVESEILLPLSHVSINAAQAELAVMVEKYEQSMKQVASLQAKLSETENDTKLLQITKKELQDLRARYESLLEAHGEKIERIEELELDLEDVKKLFREQMEMLVGKS